MISPGLTADELAHLRNLGTPGTLVDIRIPEQFNAGHLPGSVNLPDSNVIGMVHKLQGKTDVILICQDGVISALAARGLSCSRIAGVRHLEGGLSAWERIGGALAERTANGSEHYLPRDRETATTRRLRIVTRSFSVPLFGLALTLSAALLVLVALWI